MPRHTETYDLREVRDDLDERLDEFAADAQAADGDERQRIVQQAQQAETYLTGVEWALGAYDEHELVLGSLTAGEYAQVRDHVDAARARAAGDSDGAGARQVAVAAAGVVEAPFVPDGVPAGAAGFADRREHVADVAPQFVMWLEAEVDDLSTPEVSTRGFSERLAAQQTREPNSH